jgi:glutaminyl-tRNA synthetase
VRLRHAYVIRCEDVVKDAAGAVGELRCTYDPATKSGETAGKGTAAGRVKGTIHWVSARHALPAEVRLFGRLLLAGDQTAEAEGDPAATAARLDPESLTVVSGAWVEPSVRRDPVDTRYQFERNGYFWRDPVDGVGDRLVFNRIVSLKDTWARREVGPVVAESRAEVTAAVDPVSAPKPASRPRTVDPATVARAARYRTELGVADEHAEMLAAEPRFFEDALAAHGNAAEVAAWIAVDLKGLLDGRSLEDLPFGGTALGRLAALVEGGRVSRRAGKDVLGRMVREGGDPEQLIDAMGLAKVSDPTALGEAVDAVLARWPDKVAEFREGKSSLIGLFVGEVMKHTRGAADPHTAKRILTERLASD